jgi:hypothetical protein
MAAVDKYRGQDITLTITCSVSIDDLAELYVFLIHRESRTVAAQFNKAGTGTYTALTKVTEYIYKAIWGHSDTADADLGMYDMDVAVIQTDADYEDSEKHTKKIEEIFDLKESYSKIII